MNRLVRLPRATLCVTVRAMRWFGPGVGLAVVACGPTLERATIDAPERATIDAPERATIDAPEPAAMLRFSSGSGPHTEAAEVASLDVEARWRAHAPWTAWTPKGVPALKAVAVGYNHVCGLDLSGGVHCFGSNLFGQLGAGSEDSRIEPKRVSLPAPATDVAASGHSTCAATRRGVYCWGHRLLDDDETDDTPTLVGNTWGLTRIELRGRFACGLNASGSARCWGDNGSGQLGDGTKRVRRSAVAVQRVTGARELVLGEGFACYRIAKGDVVCHGSNLGAQPTWSLGAAHIIVHCSSFLVGVPTKGDNRYVDNESTPYNTPPQPPLPDGIRDAVGVDDWTCGRVPGKAEVQCFVEYGKKGHGKQVVKGSSGASALDLGGVLGCGIVRGKLLCWRNELGWAAILSHPWWSE
jgi:hypothetical protein